MSQQQAAAAEQLPACTEEQGAPRRAASPRQVTPLELVGAGAAVLSLGALAGFLGQQSGTAKQLAEEGIDPRVRLRFLPVAVSAWRCTAPAECLRAPRVPLSHARRCLPPCPPPPPCSACPRQLQAKALAASSVVCVGLGALAAGAWALAGLQFQSVAQVASWEDALALAKQQRQVISAMFKEQLHRTPDGDGSGGGGGSGDT